MLSYLSTHGVVKGVGAQSYKNSAENGALGDRGYKNPVYAPLPGASTDAPPSTPRTKFATSYANLDCAKRDLWRRGDHGTSASRPADGNSLVEP